MVDVEDDVLVFLYIEEESVNKFGKVNGMTVVVDIVVVADMLVRIMVNKFVDIFIVGNVFVLFANVVTVVIVVVFVVILVEYVVTLANRSCIVTGNTVVLLVLNDCVDNIIASEVVVVVFLTYTGKDSS